MKTKKVQPLTASVLLISAILASTFLITSIVMSQPSIIVEPVSLEFDLADEFVIERELQITNDGDALLRWSAEIEIISFPERLLPERDDPGDLLARLAITRHSKLAGWDIGSELMWFANDSLGEIFSVSRTENGLEIVNRFDFQEPYLATYLSSNFFVVSEGSRTIRTYYHRGQFAAEFEVEFDIFDLSSSESGAYIFAVDTDNNIHVFRFNERELELNEIAVIDDHHEFLGGADIASIQWVNIHRAGKLWIICRDSDQIIQLRVDENWNCREQIQSFDIMEPGENDSRRVAFDGTDLWVCDSEAGRIDVYDDGIIEQGWLLLDPMEGEVEPDSTEEVIATIDTKDLIDGAYEAEIRFYSNDPNLPEIAVSVSMSYTSRAIIDVAWDRNAGFPEEVNFSHMFDLILPEESDTIEFTVSNIGSEMLDVREITLSGEGYRLLEEEFTPLDPGEIDSYTIVFSAEIAGFYPGRLSVISNDENNNDELSIPLITFVGRPPAIVLGEEEFDFAPEGDSVRFDIRIDNEGESELAWEASAFYPGQRRGNVSFIISDGKIETGEGFDLPVLIRANRAPARAAEFVIQLATNDPFAWNIEVPVTVNWPNGTDETDPATLPDHFSLSTFPNPFNSTLTITVGLDKSTPARLTIHDLQGRVVAELDPPFNTSQSVMPFSRLNSIESHPTSKGGKEVGHLGRNGCSGWSLRCPAESAGKVEARKVVLVR